MYIVQLYFDVKRICAIMATWAVHKQVLECFAKCHLQCAPSRHGKMWGCVPWARVITGWLSLCSRRGFSLPTVRGDGSSSLFWWEMCLYFIFYFISLINTKASQTAPSLLRPLDVSCLNCLNSSEERGRNMCLFCAMDSSAVTSNDWLYAHYLASWKSPSRLPASVELMKKDQVLRVFLLEPLSEFVGLQGCVPGCPTWWNRGSQTWRWSGASPPYLLLPHSGDRSERASDTPCRPVTRTPIS